MSKRRVLALIGALLIASLVFTCRQLILYLEWPSYGGHSFNYWAELAFRHDPEAVPALRNGLQHMNSQVRSASATALGYLGPDARAAVPDLVALLKEDREAEVRFASAFALSLIEPEAPEAVLGLRSALEDQDPRVRDWAELGLRNIRIRSELARIATATVGSSSSPFGPAGLSGLCTLAVSSQELGAGKSMGLDNPADLRR